MKSIYPKSCLGLAVAAMLLGSLPVVFGESSPAKKSEYKFVIVPKVVHPWFDQVNEGAKKAAKMIEDQTGSKVSIDYRAPQSATWSCRTKFSSAPLPPNLTESPSTFSMVRATEP
jgi:ABC-type sugar transport system substrate-binding protein